MPHHDNGYEYTLRAVTKGSADVVASPHGFKVSVKVGRVVKTGKWWYAEDEHGGPLGGEAGFSSRYGALLAVVANHRPKPATWLRTLSAAIGRLLRTKLGEVRG